MNSSLATAGTGDPGVPIEGFGRLALALALSAGVHLLIAQLLPQAVKPYEGAPSAAPSTLTVSLQPLPRERPKAAVSIPAPQQSDASLDGAAQPDQPALSMLRPEIPREILPDTPPDEGRPALPLLDYYYTSREVDEPARPLGDALLVYPPEALKLRVPGQVKVRLFIDEFGALARTEVVDAAPPGIFEEAALQAVGAMRFSPARKGEQPVRSQRTVQITFDPTPAALHDTRSAPIRQATDPK